MHVATTRRVYQGKVYTSTLLRQTFRQDGKVKHRTLANLSALPDEVVDLIRRALKGEALIPATEAMQVTASRSHGAVAAVLSILRQTGLERRLGGDRAWRSLVLGMIVARVVEPGSKRFTAAYWQQTTLPALLDIPEVHVNLLYEAMDKLLQNQSAIQQQLAKHHLQEGSLVLYDLSSSYLEGAHCPLAAFGYNRDKKRGKKQFTYGLLTNQEGCPVAIEVFPGNRSDAITLKNQIQRLKEQYGFGHVVFVGDRGMITKTRIIDLQASGFDWITALRSEDIQQLYRTGALQLSLFDERGVAEIEDPAFPGERLVACRNPRMTEQRRRKREELLGATEAQLAKVQKRVQSGRLVQEEAIGLAVGRVIDRYKMGKHFDLDITQGCFNYARKQEPIAREAALDGVYVIRTQIPKEQMTEDAVVEAYRGLQRVEQAFRTMKTMQLELRPVFHRLEDRVRAHTFLCMLAYYVQWHMQQALQPLRVGGDPAYDSFRLVIERLKAIQKNTVACQGHTFEQVTQPDEHQRKILDALGVSLHK